MPEIYESLTDLIGKTPLLRLNNYAKANALEADIIAKLEYFNPAGSVKDRIAKAMLDDAEQRGVLNAGSVIRSRQSHCQNRRLAGGYFLRRSASRNPPESNDSGGFHFP